MVNEEQQNRLSPTQKYRRISVRTPLEDDVLLFHRMSATEELGRLFQMELEVLSVDGTLDLNDLLGENVTVRMERPDGKDRYFNGFVSQGAIMDTETDLFRYHLTLRPWLWFLTRTSDCRIFQDKTVPDIIKEIFQDYSFSYSRESLTRTYRALGSCVQYRESDFNFVSRILEQEGIYYYFEHKKDRHIMVLADAIGAHSTMDGYEKVPFYTQDSRRSQWRERDHIWSWRVTREVRTGAYALNDFDFEKPNKKLEVRSSIERQHAGSGHEVYDYPGRYVEHSEGEDYSKVRIEELQAAHHVASGAGNAAGLTTGCLFTLTGHPRDDQNNVQYLITSATHELVSDDYQTGGGFGDEQRIYSLSFTAIDSREAFRPARIAQKPVIRGAQTAMVVGKSGEEIWTDQYGRVKLQFHWDRYSKGDESSSRWVRVAQMWAGKNWGGLFIPRIGQEVIVEFLEGDPDRPIITGSVYNGTAKPPYELPSKSTRSTIRSNSSKGGGGFNEFRFEDKKGEEQVFVQGEKDLEIRVKNDRKEIIGHDRHLIVENERREKVVKDTHSLIEGDLFEERKGDVHITLGSDRKLKVGGSEHADVDGNHVISVGGDYSLKVSGSIAIQAGLKISLEVGGSFVTIDPSGVHIQGTMTYINSGGSAASPASPSAPSSPKEPIEAVEADA
uniref:Type VI secretion system secreted protein VgrG n=1 Tax=Candidatus Kentrum sp. DK TaxID=2126562 RepID=A0A450TH82_9GAMM|nr:MAG: type VI secretion system secreted protein VgrG [Candidatus Kentron sp. DK]VFJ67907.1 MAG: type VI secretion system secreted protein VgrG [Candidatus Kentron sp. DK]